MAKYLWLLLGLIGVSQWIFQPKFVYPGDANAIRVESSYLVATGKIGIPVAEKNTIPQDFLPPSSAQNQYLWENPERQTFYSRWGIVNTLAYAIPLYFTKAATNENDVILGLNTLNLFVTLIMAAGLFMVATQFGLSGPLASMATVAIIYGSYVFYYTRAQTVEIFHLALLPWCLVLFQKLDETLRRSSDDTLLRDMAPAFATLSGVLCLLIFSKIYFIVFAGLLFAVLWWGRWHTLSQWQGILLSGVVLLAFVAGLLWINYSKFGSIWETGLGPAAPLVPSDSWNFSHFKDSIPGFLWHPKYAAASHMVWGALGILATPWLLKVYPRQVWLVLLFFLSTVMIAGGWGVYSGEWCYGPRYLLQPLLICACLSIPAVKMALDLAHRNRIVPYIVAVVFITLFAFGLRREIVMAHFAFFTEKQLEAVITNLPTGTELKARWAHFSSPSILREFADYCRGSDHTFKRTLDSSLSSLPEQDKNSVQKFVDSHCTLNFRYF